MIEGLKSGDFANTARQKSHQRVRDAIARLRNDDAVVFCYDDLSFVKSTSSLRRIQEWINSDSDNEKERAERRMRRLLASAVPSAISNMAKSGELVYDRHHYKTKMVQNGIAVYLSGVVIDKPIA